jgi:putative MATE family efflux protein
MLISLISGILLSVLGIIFAKPILTVMKTPDEILPLAIVYLRIYFIGMPAMMVYNFGSALLRAAGDTKRPFAFLAISGVVNVCLNLVFVIVFGMDVDGVALASVISQCISAALIVMCLMKEKSAFRFELKSMRIHWDKLFEIVRIGVPAGFQGMLFSISNVIIQASVNDFGEIIVSGNTAAANLEQYVFFIMNGFHQAVISFVGQNYGARKNDRIKKVFFFSLIQVAFIGILMGQTEILLGEQLANLYINADDPNKALVIAETQDLLKVMLSFYFLCGIMEVCSGALRGLGYATITLVNSLVFACAVRLIWIYLIFFKVSSLDTISELVLAFPISWAITITAHIICILFIWRKEGIWKRNKSKQESAALVE